MNSNILETRFDYDQKPKSRISAGTHWSEPSPPLPITPEAYARLDAMFKPYAELVARTEAVLAMPIKTGGE